MDKKLIELLVRQSKGEKLSAPELELLKSAAFEKGTPEPFEIKAIEGTEDFYIEGYASTNGLDRGGDIVEPEAFREAMTEYMTNPIVFYMHGWWDLPVGKTVAWRIDEKGLWVRIYVSMTAGNVRTLIKEGILRALSIGYDILEVAFLDKGTPTERRVIKKLKLYENSIVNIPMNAEALFEMAKAKNINLTEIKTIVLPTQPETIKEDTKMDPKQIQEMIDAALAKQSDAILAKMPSFDAANATIEGLKTAIGNIPKDNTAELKAFVEKHTAEAKAAVDLLQKRIEQEWTRPTRMEFADATSIEQAKRLGFIPEKGKLTPDTFKALMLNEHPKYAAAHIGMKSQEDLVKEYQDVSDALLFLGAYKGMTVANHDGNGIEWIKSPKTLKTYQKYLRMTQEFCKAMDTETTAEGTEWLPTYMSGTLITGIEAERGVIRRIPRVAMPSKSWDWPLRTTKPVPYCKSEARSDSNVNTIILSTTATGKITFSAKGLAVASLISAEEVEDSIIAILPTLQNDFKLAINAGEENAIINGDDSTTHQDTDIAAEGAASVSITRLLKGLRYMALNGTLATQSGAAAAITYTMMVNVMKKAGKYAVAPQKGFFVVPYCLWFNMLTLTEFKTQEVFGQLAANMTGALPRVLGSDVVPSEYMRSDLNTAGVNGASGNTYTGFLYVHPEYFKIGDRRIYTVESDKQVMTDQITVVGTERIDFKKMAPSTENPVTFGYDFLTTV